MDTTTILDFEDFSDYEQTLKHLHLERNFKQRWYTKPHLNIWFQRNLQESWGMGIMIVSDWKLLEVQKWTMDKKFNSRKIVSRPGKWREPHGVVLALGELLRTRCGAHAETKYSALALTASICLWWHRCTTLWLWNDCTSFGFVIPAIIILWQRLSIWFMSKTIISITLIPLCKI